MMRKPILCVDFDGVIHSYTSGWKGADVVPDPPVGGAIEFLWRAAKVFDVQIFSSRSNEPGGIDAMRTWLDAEICQHFDCAFGGDPRDFEAARELSAAISYPTVKPPAMVTIDDRAITFTGQWPTIESLRNFQPWNKQSRSNSSTADASRNARPTLRFLIWVEARIPVEIKPGEHGQSYATSPLIKGLLVPLVPGASTVASDIAEAIEDLGLAATEAADA